MAQGNYPSRPIHIIVPYPAGGIVDIVARIVTEQVGRDLKQAIVVEAKPGANGNIGTAAVARSERDGYTWLVTGPAALVNPTLYKDAGWDAMKDLKCVGLAVWNQSVAVVQSLDAGQDASANSWNWREASPASSISAIPARDHRSISRAQKLFQAADIKLTNVGYKGQPPALIDLITNLMHFEIVSLALALPHIKAGHGQAAGRIHRQTRRRPARRADDRGSRISRSGLCPLVRHLCAISDARRAGRKDQRGHQQGAAESRTCSASCRSPTSRASRCRWPTSQR